MRSRSRDYSIKTCNLDRSIESRWIFRGTLVILAFLSRPLLEPALAAACLRPQIANFGGFLCQHLIWSLQLLGVVEFEPVALEWNAVRLYCSTQNTLKLFKRWRRDFDARRASTFTSVGFSSTDEHEFIDPLRGGRGGVEAVVV